MTLESILLTHFSTYPNMLPCDAIKLVYQNHFGASHFITDKDNAYKRLKSEYDGCRKRDRLYTEDIGNGRSRIYLGGIKEYSLNTVNNIFCLNGTDSEANNESFIEKCNIIRSLALQGLAPFSLDEYDCFFNEYSKSGYPDVHHSERYRNSYLPSYRLISSYYLRFIRLISEIDRLLTKKSRVIIAIDGDCASGKSTLANALSRIYPASVIHMDDFFLPPSIRTPERLAQPGGNVHYERFTAEVINNLGSKTGCFKYRKFDCGKMEYSTEDALVYPDSRLVIVEGSYSLRPDFISSYDLKVFLQVSQTDQLSRLKNRCASSALISRFINEWIPMEKEYARYYRIEDLADFTYVT